MDQLDNYRQHGTIYNYPRVKNPLVSAQTLETFDREFGRSNVTNWKEISLISLGVDCIGSARGNRENERNYTIEWLRNNCYHNGRWRVGNRWKRENVGGRLLIGCRNPPPPRSSDNYFRVSADRHLTNYRIKPFNLLSQIIKLLHAHTHVYIYHHSSFGWPVNGTNHAYTRCYSMDRDFGVVPRAPVPRAISLTNLSFVGDTTTIRGL